MTEEPQRGREGQTGVAWKPLQTASIGEQVALPTQHSLHHVTGLEPRVARVFDHADRDPSHHLAEGDRRDVAG